MSVMWISVMWISVMWISVMWSECHQCDVVPPQVCLASSSPPTFHFVLVHSLHRIITNVRLSCQSNIHLNTRVHTHTGLIQTLPFKSNLCLKEKQMEDSLTKAKF